MGAAGAVNIIHRSEIRSAEDPDATRADLIADYEDRLMNPYAAAARGMIDDVIDPAETRPKMNQITGDAPEQARTAPAQKAREHSSVNTRAFRFGDAPSPNIAAAVIAAVEAFLEDEATRAQSQPPSDGVSAWRMAVASRGASRGFGANFSWRGRRLTRSTIETGDDDCPTPQTQRHHVPRRAPEPHGDAAANRGHGTAGGGDGLGRIPLYGGLGRGYVRLCHSIPSRRPLGSGCGFSSR